MEHTDKHYEQGLKTLKEEILKMGGIVEQMVHYAMKALVERNTSLVKEVSSREPSVNRLEITIDELCIQLLALHQPAASDLRFISVGLKISKDLERMGDLAVNISETVEEINREPQLKEFVDLPRMAGKTQQMVKASLDAFVKQDVNAAKKVCEMDDDVDNLKDKIQQDVIDRIKEKPDGIAVGIGLISVAKNLDRVADHSTNIAEEVIFMVEGKDIRHGLAKPS